jgi:hypothetical protein
MTPERQRRGPAFSSTLTSPRVSMYRRRRRVVGRWSAEALDTAPRPDPSVGPHHDSRRIACSGRPPIGTGALGLDDSWGGGKGTDDMSQPSCII